jgi:hypothetical protein
MPDLIPLIDAPALVVKNEEVSLVLADVHLGIEHDLYYSGVNIPSQIARRLDRIVAYIEEVKPDRVILLGDIKHNVPRTSYQEEDEVPYFLSEIAKHAVIDILLATMTAASSGWSRRALTSYCTTRAPSSTAWPISTAHMVDRLCSR